MAVWSGPALLPAPPPTGPSPWPTTGMVGRPRERFAVAGKQIQTSFKRNPDSRGAGALRKHPTQLGLLLSQKLSNWIGVFGIRLGGAHSRSEGVGLPGGLARRRRRRRRRERKRKRWFYLLRWWCLGPEELAREVGREGRGGGGVVEGEGRGGGGEVGGEGRGGGGVVGGVGHTMGDGL